MSLESRKSRPSGTPEFLYLPSEIITEIFLDVCDRNPLSKPLIVTGLTIQKAPVIYPFFLGKICRGWRTMAWTCPLLWSVIHIPLSLRKYNLQLDLLKEWIERTSDCPLSIYLELHDGEGLWRGTDFLRGLYTLLVAVSSRWERIEFFLPKHSKGVLNAACLHVPLLRSATIRALSCLDIHPNFLESAPSLQNLNIKRISPKGVDCENLTSLTASFVLIDDLIEMLQNTPGLEHCDLQMTYRYGAPDSVLVLEIPLPSLRCLRLGDAHSATFLPHVGIAPMLQVLEISECRDHLSLEVISSFLEKAQCTLRRLSIGTGDTLDTNHLYVLLKGVKSLSSLEIQHYYAVGETEVFSVFLDIFDPDISQMSEHNDEDESKSEEEPTGSESGDKDRPILLPNLRKLGYQLPLQIDSEQLERFAGIVRKRWNEGKSSYSDHGVDGRHSRGDFARLEILQFDPVFSSSQRINVLLQKEVEEGLRIMFNLPLIDYEDEDP